MMTHEVGVTYTTPDGCLVVVVEDHGELVNVLLLQDNSAFKRPIAPGTVFPVIVGTVCWDDSKPFSSPEEQGKVSP